MLDYGQLKTAIAEANKRFAQIRRKYPDLDAYLVLSTRFGQADIKQQATDILIHFPSLVIDDATKHKALKLAKIWKRKTESDPDKKELKEQLDSITPQLMFQEDCCIEIRFHDLNYDIVWQLQADEDLIDCRLTPQTRASIRIVLGTLASFLAHEFKSDALS